MVAKAPTTILLVCAVLLGSLTALATIAHGQPRAITVKIEGRVSEPPEEGRPRAVWNLRVNRQAVKLYVIKLEILAGSTTEAEVIRQLKANRAAILTSGGAAALKILEDASAGQRVTIQGTMRWADTPPILLVSTTEEAGD